MQIGLADGLNDRPGVARGDAGRGQPFDCRKGIEAVIMAESYQFAACWPALGP